MSNQFHRENVIHIFGMMPKYPAAQESTKISPAFSLSVFNLNTLTLSPSNIYLRKLQLKTKLKGVPTMNRAYTFSQNRKTCRITSNHFIDK